MITLQNDVLQKLFAGGKASHLLGNRQHRAMVVSEPSHRVTVSISLFSLKGHKFFLSLKFKMFCKISYLCCFFDLLG